MFQAAVQANLIPLAVLGILTSVMGLYYYLRVIVLMYMKPSAEGEPVPAHYAILGLGLAITAGVTIIVGIGPGMLTTLAQAAAGTLGQ